MKALCLLTGWVLLMSALVSTAAAQSAEAVESQRGLRWSGLPSLNFNSDEGIGYGARLSLFNYAQGGFNPYFYTLDSEVFLTTRGRKQVYVFFDSPFILGLNHRITSELRYQYYGAAPYFGIGNDTPFREELIEEGNAGFVNEDYYGFDRKRASGWVLYQYRMGNFNVLGGAGLVYTSASEVDGPSLFQIDRPLGTEGGWTNFVKAGIVFDTRDFEAAPGRGDWTDVIFSISNGVIGSDYDYARFTLTHRHYFTLLPRLVFAERVVYEKAWGDIPFFEMAFFESSFRLNEGVGGSKTIRGLRQNRLIGPDKLFGNLELRWRFFDFRVLNQNLYLAANVFLDWGRVWAKEEDFALTDLYSGQGGGFRLGWNENFIVSLDIARSEEVPFALYLGIGYLF